MPIPMPHVVLLNFNVQPLVLGKAIVDSPKMTNVDFSPMPIYYILTSMSDSHTIQRLIKQ